MENKPSKKSAPASKRQTQSTQETTVVMQAVQPPKKSKARLIIGIVVGSLLFLGLVAIALWYFLVWQNPQNKINRVLSKTFVASKSTIESQTTVGTGENKADFSIKLINNLPNTMIQVRTKSLPNGVNLPIELGFDGILAGDATIYARINGIQKMIDRQVENTVLGNSDDLTDEQKKAKLEDPAVKAQVEQLKQQYAGVYQQFVDSVDSQWIKISKNDLPGDVFEELRCSLDVVSLFQNDTGVRNELANAYVDNAFYVISGEPTTKDGLTGYTLRVDKAKAAAFGEAVKKTAIGQKMTACFKDFGSNMRYNTSGEDGSIDEIRAWIDGSGNLNSIELSDKSFTGDTISGKITFAEGKTEAIEIPTNAKGVLEIVPVVKDLYEKVTGTSN